MEDFWIQHIKKMLQGENTPDIRSIEIGDKKYRVRIAETEEDKVKGLQGIKNLPKDTGMLFIYDKPQTVGFWMKDTKIPLDIVFIGEDYEVISVHKARPYDETVIQEDNVQFVLEVNINSGIKQGDELEFDDENGKSPMLVIGSDGKPQMQIIGGERIFSRRSTKVLIKKAKKADKSKLDKDYKALGMYAFKELDRQDNREPEYVQKKD